MKRILGILAVLLMGTSVFAQSAEYTAYMKAAKDYEARTGTYTCEIQKGYKAAYKSVWNDMARPIEMVTIPGRNYKISKTEVTQEQYRKVMGENPSYFQLSNSDLFEEARKALEKEGGSGNKPAEQVSWYDAIYFCNRLSEKEGLTPVYAVNGVTDVSKWNYTPNKGEYIDGNISQNTKASGFRLPTEEEWEHAAKGGENYTYSGSNNLDEVGWYEKNSGGMTHPVAQKKANGYGLYDMSGNVYEWVWDARGGRYRYSRGGSWNYDDYGCGVSYRDFNYANYQYRLIGFRLLAPLEKVVVDSLKSSGDIVESRYTSTMELKNGYLIEMVTIPGKNYKISKTEVTQKQYENVMGENPSYFQLSNSELSEERRKAQTCAAPW